jgi:hypothetical protein
MTMSIEFKQTIPIIRIFDVTKAKCVETIDPFGNRIRFNEDLEKREKPSPG